MTHLVLLTGFLGAGKTTFLNHLLTEYTGVKIGLVVNEFSSTGVDGALVRRDAPGVTLQELSGGSIFCACIKGSFVDALIALAGQGLEYVFVEASGLADPSSIGAILEELKALTGTEYDYQGAVCLVDALYFPDYAQVLVALRRQVEYSRAVILNKTDLVEEPALAALEEEVRAINPGAVIFRAVYAQVPLRALLDREAHLEAAPQESTNTAQSRPHTVTLATREAVPTEDLRRFVEGLGGVTYRIKGFCLTAEGTVNVSAVGGVCHMEPWPQAVEETELVIISSVGVRIVSEVLSAAKTCFQTPVELKS